MLKPALTLLTLLLLTACKTGYHRTNNSSPDTNPPPCATAAVNPNLINDGFKVFKLLADLTCGKATYDGYLMGQNAGAGNQMIDIQRLSYDRLFEQLRRDTGHTPAILSIDYEYDRIFTEEALLAVNKKLKEHWDAGGLVAISWTPLSPWRNNAENPGSNPGSSFDTLYNAQDDIHLSHLLDDTRSVHSVWRRKLDAIAVALKDLQDHGVPVLWRPLPEMNRYLYWWGLDASYINGQISDSSRYTNLWKDAYEYLTKDKAINNLIWVYSPGESRGGTAAGWAYLKDFVDVVAGIARNDGLTIEDYRVMVDLNRPLGMAYYGPTPAEVGGTFSANAIFDSRTYGDRLQGSYPAVGYWISWHSYDTQTLAGAVRSHQALIDSTHTSSLVGRNYILSLERVKEYKLR